MRLLPRCPLAWAVLALGVTAGCTPLDLSHKLSLPGLGPKPQVPTRMTDFWTDTVLYQPGLPGVRGFGGRIMFYNDSGETPIMVEGTLTVFAYDESRGQVSYSAPDKKYIFTPEQLPKHYSKSELGPSYSFWLPWDEVGGPRKKICLIARFEPVKGHMIVSSPCRKVLPGEPPEEETASPAPARTDNAAALRAETGVRHASRVEPVGPAPPLQKPPASFTIDVPPSFLRLPAAGQRSQEEPDPPSRSAPAGALQAPAGLPGPAGQFRPQGGPQASPEAASGTGGASNATTAARVTPWESPADARDANHRPPQGAAESATRFERRRPLVQRAPIAPRVHDPVRRQPLPAAWLSSLPPTPRSDSPDPTPGTNEDAGPAPR